MSESRDKLSNKSTNSLRSSASDRLECCSDSSFCRFLSGRSFLRPTSRSDSMNPDLGCFCASRIEDRMSDPPLKSVTILAPCYNEEESLPAFVERVQQVLAPLVGIEWTILLVDDGSSDRTWSVIEDLSLRHPALRGLSLSRNFGHQVALTAGLDHVSSDAVVMLDCDLQHPPELIPQFIEKWRSGARIVSAVRSETIQATWLKKLASQGFYSLIGRISETPITPHVADFCLLDRVAYSALRRMREQHRFLRGMIASLGFRREFVTFIAPPRQLGVSKYTLSRMIRMARHALTSFSSAPLRLGIIPGIAAMIFGLIYGSYIVLRYFFLGDLIPGWASLMVVVLTLGGFQLLGLGVIGEYIGNIYEQSKFRPLYFLKGEVGANQHSCSGEALESMSVEEKA